MSSEEFRTSRINLQVTSREKENIKNAAKAMNITVSQLLRDSVFMNIESFNKSQDLSK